MKKKYVKHCYYIRPNIRVFSRFQMAQSNRVIIKVEDYRELRESGVRISGNKRGLLLLAKFFATYALYMGVINDKVRLSSSRRQLSPGSLDILMGEVRKFNTSHSVKLKKGAMELCVSFLHPNTEGRFPDIRKKLNEYIRVRMNKQGELCIDGNTEGFVYLSKYLIAMASFKNAPEGMHVHLLNQSNSCGQLNKGSIELTIDNISFYSKRAGDSP